MKRYSYFLGCITPNRYPGIELATRRVLKNLGIDLIDIEGASCCPAPGVIGSFDLLTWLVIAARNISIAEEAHTDITVTCNGCYATIQEANHILKQNGDLKDEVNGFLKKIGRKYKGEINVKHIIEVLNEIGYETIQKAVRRPLTGINVAVHYGCHFLKPSDVRAQGPVEKPTIFDDFVKILDARSVDYKDKMMCCGTGGGVRAGNLDVALDYTREKINNMTDAEADCVCTLCAFCHFQFDQGQVELTEKVDGEYTLPVVFITQLLGLALGMSIEDVGLDRNKTQIDSFASKLPLVK